MKILHLLEYENNLCAVHLSTMFLNVRIVKDVLQKCRFDLPYETCIIFLDFW